MRSLPLILCNFAVSAKERKDGNRWTSDGFLTTSYHRKCSEQIPHKRGSFEATNYGNHGEVKLENYPNDIKCHHKVEADENCSAIRVSYRSIAVQDARRCYADFFRFGWPGSNGFQVTPPRCDCFGDGCNSLNYYGYYWSTQSVDYPDGWEGQGRKIFQKWPFFPMADY